MPEHSDAILLSWVARNNDPFTGDAGNIPGPTLTLLFDEASQYRTRISDAVLLLHRSDKQIGVDTKEAISRRNHRINTHLKYWTGKNPTDHKALFEFLRQRLPQIRRQFPQHEIVINVSPGTPAMHTVWMLMAETGFIDEPFSVVQTVPAPFRDGGPATVPVKIGIETFYKAYRGARPREVSAEEERIFWDPERFVSPALKDVFARAQRYASLNVPILILGERGTGKTTLANWIRNTSPYRKANLDEGWPSVPCGQYDPETMRSELFGYLKGAFTGANRDTEGLLHAADGDTLFLDEIGDISRDLQRLLIRALEDKKFFRVGAQEPEESDFRLLTATNRPFDELRDRLDADFMDRISTFVLRMPPLREISSDLNWLWRGVFDRAAERAEVVRETLPLNEHDHIYIADQLVGHPLSGNLRDLFRVAYHLIALLQDTDYHATPRTACKAAVDEGLNAISTPPGKGITHDIAEAFINQHSLDTIIDEYGHIPTDTVRDTLNHYLATELRRIARRRDVKSEVLCDKSDRTLLNWVQGT